MVASDKDDSGRPNADEDYVGYLDKKLSWNKRLEIARARRAQIIGETGEVRPTPEQKPWESEAESFETVDAPEPTEPAVSSKRSVLRLVQSNAIEADPQPEPPGECRRQPAFSAH